MDPAQFLQFMEEQRKMNNAIIDSLRNAVGSSANCSLNSAEVQNHVDKLMDTLANSISPFSDSEEQDMIFECWYSRHEDIFLVEGKILDDASKVRLLLRKLDTNSHNRYSNFILPKKTS